MSECSVATPLSLLLLLLFSTQGPPAPPVAITDAEALALAPVEAVVAVDVADTDPLSALLLLAAARDCCWLVLLPVLLVPDEGTGSSVKRKAISRSRKTSVSLGSIRLKRLEEETHVD